MLYDGFFDRCDSQQFPDIIKASPEALRDQRWVFKDARLPELLFRYRARNYPESLTAAESHQWREHCQDQVSPGGPFDCRGLLAELEQELNRDDLVDVQRQALMDLRAILMP